MMIKIQCSVATGLTEVKCVYLQQSLLPVVELRSCTTLVLQLHSLQDGTVKMFPCLLLQPEHKLTPSDRAKLKSCSQQLGSFPLQTKVETNFLVQQIQSTRRKSDFRFGF